MEAQDDEQKNDSKGVRQQTDSIEMEETEDIVLEKEGEQPSDTIKRLREKLKECTAKKQEYLSGWQRAKADLVNAKKEFDRERDRVKTRSKETLVADLLPALDSFTMAMANTKTWESVDEEWRTGVEQIHNQLLSALQKNGVEQIAPKEGESFDPQLHTSVDTKPINDEEKDGTVEKCEQIGYRLNDRIIRSAHVVVYDANSDKEDKKE